MGALRIDVCMEPPCTTHAGFDVQYGRRHRRKEVVRGTRFVSNAESKWELEKYDSLSYFSREDGVHKWTQQWWKNRTDKRRVVCTCHEMWLRPALHLWTDCFWRDGLMWCVCVELRAFCIFELKLPLAGPSDAAGRWHLTGTKLSEYYFCCMVWGKYRVCRAAFFVKLWMLGFGFDMSERMSKEMSERYVRKSVRRLLPVSLRSWE